MAWKSASAITWEKSKPGSEVCLGSSSRGAAFSREALAPWRDAAIHKYYHVRRRRRPRAVGQSNCAHARTCTTQACSALPVGGAGSAHLRSVPAAVPDVRWSDAPDRVHYRGHADQANSVGFQRAILSLMRLGLYAGKLRFLQAMGDLISSLASYVMGLRVNRVLAWQVSDGTSASTSPWPRAPKPPPVPPAKR